ncbi:hypothetical protein DFP97_12717 [Paenibacillus prosopidis]|uniref:Uncharacterized protein n=1 Tax=Paenibacillus prosopidis TaxID=630520 RepID=A0A368VN37_9BACL|nr:hypothetical protein DFP97_12717 [Paenibacillus prosopidis]
MPSLHHVMKREGQWECGRLSVAVLRFGFLSGKLSAAFLVRFFLFAGQDSAFAFAVFLRSILSSLGIRDGLKGESEKAT